MYWFYPAKRRPGPSPAGVLFGVRRLIEYARRLRPEGAPRRTPMSPSAGSAAWPELPYAAWKDSCATLQLWTQIVGKTRLALTPWLNHSWHVTFVVTARGLATPLFSAESCDLQIEFDFVDHALVIRMSDGRVRTIVLEPMTVADFHAAFARSLDELGIRIRIGGTPNETIEAIPFALDVTHRAYDKEFVNRFWRALLRSHDVLSFFRTGFLGKASPVHFFWGSFDLAVTRFSGRRAPLHPGGIPGLPDEITRESYSHEVSSAGFWPGNDMFPKAAFYSYAYPEPAGFRDHSVPDGAYYDTTLGEFILPYDNVRTAADPDRLLLEFLSSTYVAAAEAGRW